MDVTFFIRVKSSHLVEPLVLAKQVVEVIIGWLSTLDACKHETCTGIVLHALSAVEVLGILQLIDSIGLVTCHVVDKSSRCFPHCGRFGLALIEDVACKLNEVVYFLLVDSCSLNIFHDFRIAAVIESFLCVVDKVLNKEHESWRIGIGSIFFLNALEVAFLSHTVLDTCHITKLSIDFASLVLLTGI